MPITAEQSYLRIAKHAAMMAWRHAHDRVAARESSLKVKRVLGGQCLTTQALVFPKATEWE